MHWYLTPISVLRITPCISPVSSVIITHTRRTTSTQSHNIITASHNIKRLLSTSRDHIITTPSLPASSTGLKSKHTTSHYIRRLYSNTNENYHIITTPSTALRSKQPKGSEALDPFDLQFALNLDKQDPLSSYRNLFHIPRSVPGDENSPDTIYFCGNSLGLQPKELSTYLDKELKAWKELGVEGHFKKDTPWITVEDPVIEPLAHLVGARPVEVAPMNSLTVDLHFLMIHFYKPTKDRYKIIMEGDAFPSDEHAIESQVRLHGLDPATAIIQLKPRTGEYIIRTEDVVSSFSSL